jgi:hypothetical protein
MVGLVLQDGDQCSGVETRLLAVQPARDARLLVGVEALEGPRREGFYGTFTLRGDARLEDVLALYGVEAPAFDGERTLDQFLRGPGAGKDGLPSRALPPNTAKGKVEIPSYR